MQRRGHRTGSGLVVLPLLLESSAQDCGTSATTTAASQSAVLCSRWTRSPAWVTREGEKTGTISRAEAELPVSSPRRIFPQGTHGTVKAVQPSFPSRAAGGSGLPLGLRASLGVAAPGDPVGLRPRFHGGSPDEPSGEDGPPFFGRRPPRPQSRPSSARCRRGRRPRGVWCVRWRR